MIQYPLIFRVRSQSASGVLNSWQTQAITSHHDPVPLKMAVPPEFEGPGGSYSPEDLYALALANCFVATFVVIAEKSKLVFASIVAEGALTVDRGEGGVPWMSAFELSLSLTGVADVERAQRLLEKTKTSCMILNSVKTEKRFHFTVS